MTAVTRSSASVTPVVSNIVSGRIVHKETGNGLANLQIDLFDLDSWPDPELGTDAVIGRAAANAASGIDVSTLYRTADRIGSVITDDSGKIEFNVVPKDFNLPGKKAEEKPDLALVVLAPDEPGLDLNARVLHIAKDIRLNAGSKEGYIIRLPTSLLAKHEIPVTVQREATVESAGDDVARYIARKNSEQAFTSGIADYHGKASTKEITDRQVFRKDFVAKIATDFSKVPVNGVLVAEGDNIQEKNNQVVAAGIVRANSALGGADSDGVPVNLYLTPADKGRLQSYFDNATGGFAEIPDGDMGDILFRSNSSENPGTLLVNNNPIANFCAQETTDIKCAREHAGLGDHMDDDTSSPPIVPNPPADGGITNSDVPTYIGRLLKNMPFPDVVLQPELAQKRANRATVEKAVNDFSLQKGPAEVPAFYDFNVLQIAFDHVWKQLFDERIPNLAYTANILGQQRFGVSDIVSSLFNNGLSLVGTYFAISPVEVPPVVAKFFDITKEEYNDMSVAIREQLVVIANAIDVKGSSNIGGLNILGNGSSNSPGLSVQKLRQIQALTEQGERLIEFGAARRLLHAASDLEGPA